MRIYWFGDYKFLFSFYLCIISFIYCLYLLFGYQGCHQGNVLLYSAPSSLPILFRCFLQLWCIICPPNVRGKSSFVGIFHVPYWIIGQNMRICKKVIHVKYFQTIFILYIYLLDFIYHIQFSLVIVKLICNIVSWRVLNKVFDTKYTCIIKKSPFITFERCEW